MNLSLISWICWGSFALAWGAGALYNAVKGPSTRKRRPGLENQFIVRVALALIAIKIIPSTLWATLTINSVWLQLLGAVCLVVSTVFAIWARFVLGRLWSSLAMIKEDHELRTGGPYRITRHPIYTGLLGMLLGTSLIHGLGYFIPIFIVAVIAVQGKIRSEERLLSETFEERFNEYKRAVPQLIPGLKWR